MRHRQRIPGASAHPGGGEVMAVPVKKYKVILIEEGLGNLQTCFYYTREALQSAVDEKIFEGKKCYADHPDAIEAKTRPERSVRDVVGFFEQVHMEDGPAGQAQLVGTLVMPQSPQLDWARVMVESAIDNSGRFDSELLGLSINASGISEQKDIESYMAENTIPISAQPKLLQAQAEGIEQIEVCTRLTESVSCDMVTEAGAKGRFQKVLESERKRMAKKPVDPKLKKKTKESEDGAPAGDATHQDKDQDVELIKSLLKQYVGGEDHSDEEVEAMKQALGHAKEMGMEGEEAEKAAGYSMKMAKHVASKQAEAEPEEGEAEENEESEDAAPAGGKGGPSGGDTDQPAGDAGKPGAKMKQESAKILKLEARNAAIEAKLAALELEKHIDKTVRESGLPKHAQKKLRECLVKSKSEKEVDEKLAIFKEAFGVPAEELGFNPERVESGGGAAALSLADCVLQD